MEEQERLVQVKEWAKLKLVGRPLLTGRDLWVALRPLPRLVHIYYDSSLRALLRFPEDPIFLLFTPLEDTTSNLDHVKGSASESAFIPLLVITSDGCLWFIPHISSNDLGNRPAKKIKGHPAKEGTEDTWDIFEECDIYKDTDLYPDHDIHAGSELASLDPSKAHLLCKVLKLKTSENANRRVRAENVQPKTLIGKFPDACVAAVGPNKLIAVVSLSRSPIILNGASSSHTDFPAPSTTNSHSNKETRPTCLLFATIRDKKQRHQSEGIYLSPYFFNALARGLVGDRPKHLLLQGNTLGEVHIFPVDFSDHISAPMLLYDLQEPISGLVAFTLNEVSDVLLVISSHGFLVAIIASQIENKSTPFLTSVTEPSLQRLLRIDLRDAYSVQSWRVKAPVVSVTAYRPGQLYLHSASSVYFVNLLENISMEHTRKSSHAGLTGEIPVEVAMKKPLICKILPFFDVVIALTEGNPVVPGKNSGSLVGLTSRGRLVSLQISDNIVKAETECSILAEHVKTWKPMVKSRVGDVMVLLDEIAATDSCTKALEVMKTSIDSALSELSMALRLCYDLVKNRDRDTLIASSQSFTMPLITSLLEVKPSIISVDSKRLCFRPAQNDHSCFAQNVSNLRLSLKVTLSNRGPYPLSPYWILLLDVHVLEETSRNVMFFSRLINDGYGLLPQASSAMDFEISCAGNGASPLEIDLFLCHVHEHHDELLQTSAFSHMRTSEVDRERCEHIFAKYLLQSMGTPNSTSVLNSKAACLLLSSYRVDILSLVKSPQKVHHAFDFLSFQLHQERVGGQKDGNFAPGTFLGKFQLNCMRVRDPGSLTSQTSEERWRDNGLEDMVKCCAVSKDGRELIGADVHGNTMLLTLDNKQLGGECILTTEIQMSASCAIMGCMVREAVLGRLKQQLRCWKLLGADICGPVKTMDQVLNMLVDIGGGVDLLEKDTENTLNLWHANHIEHSELYSQVHSIFECVVKMYRRYREHDASNPFWGLVGQVCSRRLQ